MQDRLIFLIGSPRSGSTLLARMLGAHSEVHAPPEPHLITPLAHLGYYASVERAEYDPIITRLAIQEIVGELPQGEEDYLDCLRAYTDGLYQRLLAPSGRTRLLDKTPAYALTLDFLARLYPKARYVVLTRHPLSIWSSLVDSFFAGDHRAAHDFNPLLERYVPAIARFLREAPVPHAHVQYEALVADPHAELARICEQVGMAFEPDMVEYGRDGAAASARGLGDPITVAKESRPTTASIGKWAEAMARDPDKLLQAREILEHLDDADLATWGYDAAAVRAELDAVTPAGARPSRASLTRYQLERRLLMRLRRNIHHNALGRLVRRIRFACDVLLR